VTEVDFAGLIGTGQTGRNARFMLTWSDPTGRPASVVAKIPSADPNARASAFTTGNYVKEWLFYDRIAPTVDITVPKCFVARYDEATPDFVLIMEDIAGSEQGDQLEGLSPDRISTAIGELVGLHAPHFGSPELATLLHTGQPTASTPDELGLVLQLVYGATMAGFLDRLGDRLDDDIVQLVDDFAPHIANWTQGTDTPPTLIHLDYRADNLLFGVDEGAPPLVVVDWQTLSAGLGASDLAYLISGSYPDATQRAADERAFVEEYRSRMATAGVELTADAIWRDYRVGSLWGMIITVVATMAAAQTERGDDMLTAMAQRHGRQALDLDALSLIG
jgi:aminoglycoside phosphotransferase (APT) family kinase protein